MSLDLFNYELPFSVWQEIKKHVTREERREIKVILGVDSIIQTKELRSQIKMLLDMYENLREDVWPHQMETTRNALLPEPPNVRDHLTQEILFFAQNIRTNAVNNGWSEETVFKGHKKEIIDYAYESGSSRPSTATLSSLSRPSTRQSSGVISPPSCRSDSSMSISTPRIDTNINGDREKMNYLNFDDVKKKFQEFIHKEIEQLNIDFNEIQMIICQKDSEQCSTARRCHVPTLTDLKLERTNLERTMHTISRQSSLLTEIEANPIEDHYDRGGQGKNLTNIRRMSPCHNKPSKKATMTPTSNRKPIIMKSHSIITSANAPSSNIQSPSLCKRSSIDRDLAAVMPTRDFKPNSAQRFRKKIMDQRAKEQMK